LYRADQFTIFFYFSTGPDTLKKATNYLYESLVDEVILGVVFETHHAYKSGSSMAIAGQPEEDKHYTIVEKPDVDIFGSSIIKKTVDCTCPNCDRLVATSRFAPHLEKCMGMGRNSSRIASRRIANRDAGGNNYFVMSDDEDDADWSGEKRKKKILKLPNNGTKKNGKT
jgi:SAGA-associated factor 11